MAAAQEAVRRRVEALEHAVSPSHGGVALPAGTLHAPEQLERRVERLEAEHRRLAATLRQGQEADEGRGTAEAAAAARHGEAESRIAQLEAKLEALAARQAHQAAAAAEAEAQAQAQRWRAEEAAEAAEEGEAAARRLLAGEVAERVAAGLESLLGRVEQVRAGAAPREREAGGLWPGRAGAQAGGRCLAWGLGACTHRLKSAHTRPPNSLHVRSHARARVTSLPLSLRSWPAPWQSLSARLLLVENRVRALELHSHHARATGPAAAAAAAEGSGSTGGLGLGAEDRFRFGLGASQVPEYTPIGSRE